MSEPQLSERWASLLQTLVYLDYLDQPLEEIKRLERFGRDLTALEAKLEAMKRTREAAVALSQDAYRGVIQGGLRRCYGVDPNLLRALDEALVAAQQEKEDE